MDSNINNNERLPLLWIILNLGGLKETADISFEVRSEIVSVGKLILAISVTGMGRRVFSIYGPPLCGSSYCFSKDYLKFVSRHHRSSGNSEFQR